MCGIAGIMRKKPSDIGSEMTAMLQSLEHRGPDSTGFAMYGMPGKGEYVLRFKVAEQEDMTRGFEIHRQVRERRAEVDRRLEDAAENLGARPLTVFRRITLPLIMPAVLSGLLFAMVISFDELVVSLFISTPTVRPVTVQMWSNIRGATDPTIAAIATLLFLFSLTALLLEGLARRKSRQPGAI